MPRAPATSQAAPGASALPVLQPPVPPSGPTLATYRGGLGPGALWSHGSRLGGLDLQSGQDAFVVTMPRGESVACGGWSDDGSLVSALSTTGSLALWSREGQLLAELPGRRAADSCSPQSFEFAPSIKRVLDNDYIHHPRLLGPGVAVELVDPAAEPSRVRFSADGRRVFSSPFEQQGQLRIYDASTGALLGEQASSSAPSLSPDGRYYAITPRKHEVSLRSYESLAEVRSLVGDYPKFFLGMLLVDQGEPSSQTVAYALDPFTQRWQKPHFDVWSDEDGGAYRNQPSGPWRLGMSPRGYALYDVAAGKQLASWPASGFACGYQWEWERDTLVFIEGSLLTFWTKASGAKTHRRRCEGALYPIFTQDRQRFLGLDSVWDITWRRPLATLDMPDGSEVWGFSHDEQLVLGAVASDAKVGLGAYVAWSTATGAVAWRAPVPDAAEGFEDMAWTFLDERDGKIYWVSRVVDAEHVAPLVFDQECWAGPARLPAELPAGFPKRNCPDLLPTFLAMVRDHAFTPRRQD